MARSAHPSGAANLAIDRQRINDALTLGHSLVSGNLIVPSALRIFLAAAATGLRSATGQGAAARGRVSRTAFLMAASIIVSPPYANIGESVVDNLLGVGIRTKLRPIERAAFIKGYSEKKSRM